MKTKVALIILAILLIVPAIYYANYAHDLRQQLQQTPPPPVATTPAPPPNLETARLRKLLNEREIAYAQLEAGYRQLSKDQSPTQQHFAAPAVPVAATPSTSNTNRLSWLERMRQDDPDRYKQIVTERDQRRKAMEQWFQDRVTALDQRAQSAPTQEEAELATKIADNLAKLNDLRQQWQSIRELPDDEREIAIQQLQADSRETYQNLRTLGQQDRQLQLQKLAQGVGYTAPGDIQKFITAVGDIYQGTDYTPHGMGFGGGGGGGRNRDAATQPALPRDR